MDLSKSTLLPESIKSLCSSSKSSTGNTHVSEFVDAGPITKRPPSKTQAHPTASLGRSAAPRFNIRSAKSLSLDLSTPNKQHNLRQLLNFFEQQDSGTSTEDSRESQEGSKEGTLDASTKKVSMAIDRNISEAWITSTGEFWPKSPNHEKITALDQLRPNGWTSQVMPEPVNPISQGDQSGQGTGRRGRSEWRSTNFSNRSKSLDWRSGVSNMDKGERIGLGEFLKNRGAFLARRSESFEEGGGGKGREMTSPRTAKLDQRLTVSSRIMEYSAGEKGELNKLKIGSVDQPMILEESRLASRRGQSMPFRIKPRLSDCELKRDVSVSGLRRDRTWRAGDLSSNKSISDRIEKLFGSGTSEFSTKPEARSADWFKTKRNSAPVEDWPLHWKLGERSRRWSSTSNTYELASESSGPWIGVAYEGGQGGTFPRRYSKGENQNFRTGSSWISRNGQDGRIVSTMKSSNILEDGSEWSGDRSSGRLHKTHNSVIEPDGGGFRARGSGPFSAEPKSVNTPKITPPQKQVHSTVDGEAISDRDPPLAALPEAVKIRWEKERECEKGEFKKIMGMDLDQERDEEWNILQHKGGFKDRTTDRKPGNDQGCKKNYGDSKGAHKEKTDREEKDDVFTLNRTPSALGTKPNGELKTGVASTSLENVRSKINRFESLSQQSQSMPHLLLQTRRTFSAPDQPKEVSGVMRSESDKILGGVRGQWSVSTGEKQNYKREVREEAAEGRRRNWQIRSLSVDEVGLRSGDRGNEVLTDGISFPQETKWSSNKGLSYNSTIDSEPQKDFKASQKLDSSRLSLPETGYALGQQGEASKSLITKDMMPTLQTNYNTSNGIGKVTGIANISNKNANDSRNISETDEGHKTSVNSSSRSPFISCTESDDAPGSDTCADQTSEKGPQDSASAQSTIEASTPSVCIDRVPPTPVHKSALSNSLLHPATSFLSANPQPSSGRTPQNQPKSPKETSRVCLGRWSSDEDSSDDDDDDDEGTERGSDYDYDSDSGESSVTITSNMSQSDRQSFSVSLADLCHFGGVDYKGYDDDLLDEDLDDRLSYRTASLSSDISAFSTISILPTEELDRLLDEVRGLGDDALQNYEDVQVVVLHKEVGCGLGFTVAGGVDQNKPITVHKVFPSGLAAQEGSMKEGDQVLSINGTALKNSAHWEALRILRRARSRGMAVVVLQRGGAAETRRNGAHHSQAAVDQHTVKEGRIIKVVLNKSSTDLGFSLEGGWGSNIGDRPLTVKKLFQGGPVGDVLPGDELLEIEGQTMQGLRRLEAWNLIKKLPPGLVEVMLNRPFKP
ncbi:hypothetical protein GJAV_G00007850 [Gymnothorax javanicus]|nr:hypothetical protein GJAV_G00007850 [Gymnothorax javanicus]